ncbi:unnamed protein product [Fusarium venenatum]|uniref:Antifungal protein n=1 Tax=Fusarium venenatum TaxID=56646 RepID=A0A2L2TZM2_9HYPO|nr:uncharacterized protein FVRRES_07967 [Fusarium venenatum]KAH6964759.1 antifungal protein [Fusarium venenatum]CEI67890.1 unnamed protein product [Fusarium venenatum]
MQFSTIFSLFIAAMGIVATPIDSPTQELDARGNLFPRLEYWGSCTKSNNRCKYKNDDDNSVLQNCLSFNNKKCTKDGNNCKWDSAKKELNYY